MPARAAERLDHLLGAPERESRAKTYLLPITEKVKIPQELGRVISLERAVSALTGGPPTHTPSRKREALEQFGESCRRRLCDLQSGES